jgi:hypothetical protein
VITGTVEAIDPAGELGEARQFFGAFAGTPQPRRAMAGHRGGTCPPRLLRKALR